MPARDGSGPMGMGSRTGRGLGNCSLGSVGGNKTTTSNYPLWLGTGSRVLGTIFGFFRRRGQGNRQNRSR